MHCRPRTIAGALAIFAVSTLMSAWALGCRRPPPRKATGPTYFDDAAPLVKAFLAHLGKGELLEQKNQVCRARHV